MKQQVIWFENESVQLSHKITTSFQQSGIHLQEQGTRALPMLTKHTPAFLDHDTWLIAEATAFTNAFNPDALEQNAPTQDVFATKEFANNPPNGSLITIAPHKKQALQQTLPIALKNFQQCSWASKVKLLLISSEAYPSDVINQCLHTPLAGFIPAHASDEDILNLFTQYTAIHRHIQNLTEQVDAAQTLNRDLEKRNMSTEKELDKTRELQLSLLPPGISDDQSFNPFAISKLHYKSDVSTVHGLYLPCDAIGGDLYDMIEFADGTLGILMSDVSGHGVPAAFVTAMLKSAFYKITHQYHSPDQVLYHLNNQLAGVVKTGHYSTAFYMHFDEANKTIHFAGAGHPYPCLYRAKTGTIEHLEENGMPLVWVPDTPYAMQELQLYSGDKLLIFTDGITELGNPAGDMYGEENVDALLKQVIETGAKGGEILDEMLVTLSDFTQGHPLGDDMTMMLIDIQ